MSNQSAKNVCLSTHSHCRPSGHPHTEHMSGQGQTSQRPRLAGSLPYSSPLFLSHVTAFSQPNPVCLNLCDLGSASSPPARMLRSGVLHAIRHVILLLTYVYEVPIMWQAWL